MALVQQSAELVVSAGLGDDTGTVVFPGNTTAGNLLVFVCWNMSSTGTAFASTGFSTDVVQQGGSGNGAAVAILSQANIAGGTTTYTVNLPSGGNWRVKGYEFNNVVTTSHVEAFENNANDTTNDPTAAPSGTIDTTVGGPIVVGYILDRTLASISGPTGFTGFTGTPHTNAYQGYSAYNVAAGASTDQRGAVTFSSGANYEAVIVAYKAASAGGYTLTLDTGSYSISGQAVTTRATRLTDLSPGSYSWTGQDVSLIYTMPGVYILPLDPGSYVITGSDALIDLSMVLDAGSYSIGGQSVDFTVGVPAAYSIPLNPGSYNWSGKSIALRWSGEPVSTTKLQKISVSIGARIG
jgi:hypothetical protein